MDAASMAIGIVALYTTCRECFTFFTAVRTADAEASLHVRELEIQQSILKAWGFHWRIQYADGSELEQVDHTWQKQNKLHEYLQRNPFKAEGVFKTLSAIADTLSNQEKLIKRYGIQLRPVQSDPNGPQSTNNVELIIQSTSIEDVHPVVREIQKRLSLLNKFKWALKDKNNFKILIVDLRSHSESLYRLCPENAFESMNIYFILECLARQESPAGLKWTSKLAAQQAEDSGKSSVLEGYKLLASAASLKASVNENRRMEQADDTNLTSVDEEQREVHYLGKGLALFDNQVVYVEMRDYRGPPLDLTPEQKQQIIRQKRARDLRLRRQRNRELSSDSSDNTEEDIEPIKIDRPADPKFRALIRDFFKTFRGANRMESVYGLDIVGMIDHTEGEYKGHCSILYKLPRTIGVHSRKRPPENLKLRAPVTLLSLLERRETEGVRSMLGARFELARKLVRAVCLLHSSGWVHKNIRSESVMFFPEHVAALQEDRYEMKVEIDVSKPILMGYIFSRPDDIVIKPPSAPGMEERSDLKSYDESSRPPVAAPSSITYQWRNPLTDIGKKTPRNAILRVRNIYGSNMGDQLFSHELTKDTNIGGFTLDYYQHPAKHANPRCRYRHAYDVYSLGIVLIEIGLWQKLSKYEDSRFSHDEEDHYEQRRWICRQYLDRLRWECGDIYADVVLSCLMIDSGDDEFAKTSDRELCARIVAELQGCQA